MGWARQNFKERAKRGGLEGMEVDIDVIAALDRVAQPGGQLAAFARNVLERSIGTEERPVDPLREFVKVRWIARRGAAREILEHVLDGGEFPRTIPSGEAVRHDEVDHAAGTNDAVPLDERSDGVGDMFEHV